MGVAGFLRLATSASGASEGRVQSVAFLSKYRSASPPVTFAARWTVRVRVGSEAHAFVVYSTAGNTNRLIGLRLVGQRPLSSRALPRVGSTCMQPRGKHSR